MHAGRIDISHHKGLHVVALSGEHDLASAPQLADAIDGCFAVGSRIVVDLGEATFFDCSVINALVAAARRASSSEHDALVVAFPPGGYAADVLALVSLPTLVSCYPTREDALRALAGRPAGVRASQTESAEPGRSARRSNQP